MIRLAKSPANRWFIVRFRSWRAPVMGQKNTRGGRFLHQQRRKFLIIICYPAQWVGTAGQILNNILWPRKAPHQVVIISVRFNSDTACTQSRIQEDRVSQKISSQLFPVQNIPMKPLGQIGAAPSARMWEGHLHVIKVTNGSLYCHVR